MSVQSSIIGVILKSGKVINFSDQDEVSYITNVSLERDFVMETDKDSGETKEVIRTRRTEYQVILYHGSDKSFEIKENEVAVFLHDTDKLKNIIKQIEKMNSPLKEAEVEEFEEDDVIA